MIYICIDTTGICNFLMKTFNVFCHIVLIFCFIFTMITVHYKVASGHREHFSTFLKPFQLLPPDCLPESPVSIDSESVIQIKIGALLVGVFHC